MTEAHAAAPGALPYVAGAEGSLPAPGSEELVARGVALAGLRPGSLVADLGCGDGRSVALLRSAFRIEAVGLDLAAPPAAPGGVPLVRADAGCLPFADAVLDGALLECVLSIAAGREAILQECARALAPGGKLIVTDLYAREGPGPAAEAEAAGPGARGPDLATREAFIALVASTGFEAIVWEDHSAVLKRYAFALAMEGAPLDEIRRRLGWAPRSAGQSRGGVRAGPGYALLVATRRA